MESIIFFSQDAEKVLHLRASNACIKMSQLNGSFKEVLRALASSGANYQR